MNAKDDDLIEQLYEDDCECYWKCYLEAEKLGEGFSGIELYCARQIMSDNAWKTLCAYFKERGVDCQAVYEKEAQDPCHEECEYEEYFEGFETSDLYPDGNYFIEI